MLKMRTILLLMSLFLPSLTFSEGVKENIPPISRQANGANKAEDNTKTQQSITVALPAVINTTVTGHLKEKTGNGNAKTYDEPMKWSEWFITIFTGLLVVVTGCLVEYTKRLWASTRDLVDKSEQSTRIIERAYVKMSHTEPGITCFGGDAFLIEMKVENLGNTPADVIDVHLQPILQNIGEPLPEVPPYIRQRDQRPFHAYLVKRDFFFYRNPELFRIGQQGWSDVIEGSKVLYIFGYVDYVDKFSVTHRFGYARRFNRDPPKGENNLAFVNQAGYNYDRPRKECECSSADS